MTYVLTVYFIFAFGVVSVRELTPDLDTCKAEAEKIASEFTLPSSAMIWSTCTAEELGAEV